MHSRLAPFLGRWIDGAGRRLTITEGRGGALVSLADASGAHAPLAVLGGEATTAAMPAAVGPDGALVVEAGTPGVGPTYVLAPTADGGLGPSVHMGLYEDWEDDLGVPWALPLSPFRRADRDP